VNAFSAADERFMRRALALAEKGRGTTRPNPVVGAVVVRDGRIIGEGFHKRAGEPHAEINALSALDGGPGAAHGATLYVTLEPCCHVGRTGPCTAAVLESKLARVVVGCGDPNPLVDGGGIARLRRAGVQVDVGCLEHECHEAIRAYAVWISEQRPLVTLKAAATLDGVIADGSRRKARSRSGSRRAGAAGRARAARRARRRAGGRGDGARGRSAADRARGGKERRAAEQPLRVVLAGRRALPGGRTCWTPRRRRWSCAPDRGRAVCGGRWRRWLDTACSPCWSRAARRFTARSSPPGWSIASRCSSRRGWQAAACPSRPGQGCPWKMRCGWGR
jgi:riboflavin biosynthesis protein RibD